MSVKYVYRCGPKPTDQRLWFHNVRVALECMQDKFARLTSGLGNYKGADVTPFTALRNPTVGFHIVGHK